MPLYMDRHDPDPDRPFSPEDIISAHGRDLEVQDRFGVQYHTAIVDVGRQTVFCIVEGPNKEACDAVHRESHGLRAGKLIEINHDLVHEFFGHFEGVETGDLMFSPALRTIVFTDIAESTALNMRIGDSWMGTIRREHDEIVRSAIREFGGRQVKHTGDGVMACFQSVVRAAEFAIQIQKAIHERTAEDAENPIRIRVGLHAGEPVAEGDDLFGAAVNLAKRICDAAEPGAVVGSQTVRDLAMGKDLAWDPLGPTTLKGFDEPVPLYRLSLPQRES